MVVLFQSSNLLKQRLDKHGLYLNFVLQISNLFAFSLELDLQALSLVSCNLDDTLLVFVFDKAFQVLDEEVIAH